MRAKDASSSLQRFNADAYGFTTDSTETYLYIGPDDTPKTKVCKDIMTAKTEEGARIRINLSDFLKDIYTNRRPTFDTIYT